MCRQRCWVFGCLELGGDDSITDSRRSAVMACGFIFVLMYIRHVCICALMHIRMSFTHAIVHMRKLFTHALLHTRASFFTCVDTYRKIVRAFE